MLGQLLWLDELNYDHVLRLMPWLGVNAEALFANALLSLDVQGRAGSRHLEDGPLEDFWQGDGWQWMQVTPICNALRAELARHESQEPQAVG